MEMMEQSATDRRLDDLNHKVDQGFARVETEMRALRGESQAEFVALRPEIKGDSSALRQGMKEESSPLRQEMKEESSAVRREMKEESSAVRSEIKSESAALRAEIKAGIDSMHNRLDVVDEGFHGTQRLMVQVSCTLLGTVVVACAGLIATQL